MSRNVELKARVARLEDVAALAAPLADRPPFTLLQHDTFYVVRSGRMKLREITTDDGHIRRELIAYRRGDAQRPRLSEYYRLVPVGAREDPATADEDKLSQAADGNPGSSLPALLHAVLGVRGVVSKRRTVMLIGQSRLHLDEVEGLGTFVELEVVLKPDQSEASGRTVAESLMRRLGIGHHAIEPRAYIDLLEEV